MKEIYTLIPDVQKLLTQRGWYDESVDSYCSEAMATRLRAHYTRGETPGKLRLSRMGTRCRRQVWYEVHHPELAEGPSPREAFTYAYGHLIEGLALTLAKAAGHTVEAEQHEVLLDGVAGHCDCLIDGYVVDVKSSTSQGMAKYKGTDVAEVDRWGYLAQLDGYVVGDSSSLVLNKRKDKAFLWVIDKNLGNMLLYEHHPRETFIRERVRDYKAISALDKPPRCTCEIKPFDFTGGATLGIVASYSKYKSVCWPELRTDIVRGRPVYHVREDERNVGVDLGDATTSKPSKESQMEWLH